MTFMQQLQLVLPVSVNIPQAYANGSDEEQTFVANLGLFFTGFFRSHIGLLEAGGPEAQQALLMGLEYLLAISYVDNLEVFKVRNGTSALRFLPGLDLLSHLCTAALCFNPFLKPAETLVTNRLNVLLLCCRSKTICVCLRCAWIIGTCWCAICITASPPPPTHPSPSGSPSGRLAPRRPSLLEVLGCGRGAATRAASSSTRRA